MLILIGGDSMEVKVISSSSQNGFEQKLNEFLSELAEQEKEVIDIKYQTQAYTRNSSTQLNHSALVIYK